MAYLFTVSLIWAFSFGLIGHALRGIDPFALALVRLSIATLVFLPFLRRPGGRPRDWLIPMGIGAIQYGLMYALLFSSYRTLQSHEVALFTVLTPVYVTLFDHWMNSRKRLWILVSTGLAVAGGAVIRYHPLTSTEWVRGFLLMQGSNAAFAFGQVAYRRWLSNRPARADRRVFALLYAGAALVCLPLWLWWGQPVETAWTPRQWVVMLYLGAIASGWAFFLWNAGARRVNTGTLAIFNNLKIPLAVTVSLVFFGEQANVPRLLTGGAVLVAALCYNEYRTGLEKRMNAHTVGDGASAP